MESLTRYKPIARVDGAINFIRPKCFKPCFCSRAVLACGKNRSDTNLLDSDDVRHMLNALSALGINYNFSTIAPAVYYG